MALLPGLVGAPSSAEARNKKKPKRVVRTEEASYVGFAGVGGVAEGMCETESIGCVRFPVEEGERYIEIELTDTSGQPAYAAVYVNGYPAPPGQHEHVCGASEAPFAIAPGLQEVVVVLTQSTAGVAAPCVGATLSGTVTARLSNLP